MPEPTDNHEAGSLLADLGRLRAKREEETTTDLPLPGFADRLWGTFRLPKGTKASQVSAMLASDNQAALGACLELIAQMTTAIYLCDDEDAEAPIRDPASGQLRDGFRHLPGGTDQIPVAFGVNLEAVTDLCPARPGGKAHTPETRVRTLFAADGLVQQMALSLCGWALGGGDAAGELNRLSERFVGESKGGPM